MRVSLHSFLPLLWLTSNSIVEFASPEDARRAKEEISDKAFMGRSVFIREVRHMLLPEYKPDRALISYRTVKRPLVSVLRLSQGKWGWQTVNLGASWVRPTRTTGICSWGM